MLGLVLCLIDSPNTWHILLEYKFKLGSEKENLLNAWKADKI